MKKLIIAMALLFGLSSMAQAATVTWEHDGQNTVGYTLYFWKTSVPGTKYNKTITGSSTRTMTVDTNYFELGTSYTFEMSAYNNQGEGPRSSQVSWTRPGTPYSPGEDSLPSTLFMTPSGINQIVITLP